MITVLLAVLSVVLAPKIAQGQTLADTALVQMARADVGLYDIPQVGDLVNIGIVRSRINTVYPASWRVENASLTNGEAFVSLFVVKLVGREIKTQTSETFQDEQMHRQIAAGKESRYVSSAYFRTAAGKNAVRINMYREKGTRCTYTYVYFVMLNASTMVSATAWVSGSGASRSALKTEAGKYEVLFDAIVKNIDRR